MNNEDLNPQEENMQAQPPVFDREKLHQTEETYSAEEEYAADEEYASLQYDESSQADYDYYDEDRPSDEPISGWLALFLYMGIGGGILITLISNLVTYLTTPTSLFTWFDMAYFAIFAVTGIMTIIGFFRRWPDAVALAKTFVVMTFLSGLVLLFTGEFQEGLRPVVWGVIWFIFLCCSAKVDRIIPPSFRKMSRRCWILIVLGVATLVTSFVFAFTIVNKITTKNYNKTATLASLQLADNQYSDGAFIVTAPEGFTGEKTKEQGLTVINIMSDSYPYVGASLTGGYSLFDQDEFENSWREFKYSLPVTITDKNTDILVADTPYTLYSKEGERINFLGPNVPIWFVVLYDEDSMGFCMIQFVGEDENDIVLLQEIIKNIEILK